MLSHVNQVSRIIRTVVRNPIKFSKETQGPLLKTVRISFEPLKTDSILEWALHYLMSQCLTYGTLRFLVSRHLMRSVWRWFRLILSLAPLGVGFGPSFLAVVSSYAFVVF